MPNWCDNELTVVGKAQDVSAFVAENRCAESPEDSGKDLELSFAAMVPETGDPNDGNYDWYQWRCAKWGTKWDLDADSVFVEIADSGCQAEYGFQTAWAPPEEWLLTVSQLYPSLRFKLRWIEESEQVPYTSYYRNGGEIPEYEFISFHPIRIENAEKVAF